MNKLLRMVIMIFTLITMSTVSVFAADVSSAENTEPTEKENYPISVNGQQFDGTGTAVDYSISNGKEFYTINTYEDEVYYLIIDHDKSTDNVYFLREVNEAELNARKGSQLNENTKPKPEETPIPEVVPEKSTENNIGEIILLVGFFIAVLGVGYYVKILKPKKEKARLDAENDDEREEELDYEDIDYSEDNDVEEDE